MIIGFTGTSKGMSVGQRAALERELRGRTFTFHHGDCVGADAQAHDIAKAAGGSIVIHPPTDSKARAYCVGGRVLPPYPYLERNHHIVDACDVLIAAPRGAEVLRSGTWATVRYAQKIGKPVLVLP